MGIVLAPAAVSPVANTLGGQGWRQAGELGVELLLSGAIGLEREVRQGRRADLSPPRHGARSDHGRLHLGDRGGGIGGRRGPADPGRRGYGHLRRRHAGPAGPAAAPAAGGGRTSTLQVRYPDGRGILRRVLNKWWR
jgi:hypothetical protein